MHIKNLFLQAFLLNLRFSFSFDQSKSFISIIAIAKTIRDPRPAWANADGGCLAASQLNIKVVTPDSDTWGNCQIRYEFEIPNAHEQLKIDNSLQRDRLRMMMKTQDEPLKPLETIYENIIWKPVYSSTRIVSTHRIQEAQALPSVLWLNLEVEKF